jgi:initiation factor 1A
MVRNQKGGAKFKKYKTGAGVLHEEKLVECDDTQGEHYGYVKSKLGNGRFKVDIVTERGTAQVDCVAILSGRMKKKKWKNFVGEGTLVLLSTLEDGNKDKEKYWIIHRYDEGDVRALTRMNHIKLSEYHNNVDDGIGFCVDEEEATATATSTLTEAIGGGGGAAAGAAVDAREEDVWEDFETI